MYNLFTSIRLQNIDFCFQICRSTFKIFECTKLPTPNSPRTPLFYALGHLISQCVFHTHTVTKTNTLRRSSLPSFAVRRSSFVVRRSSFVVRRSSFVDVRCRRSSPFVVRRSPFVVYRSSPFVVVVVSVIVHRRRLIVVVVTVVDYSSTALRCCCLNACLCECHDNKSCDDVFALPPSAHGSVRAYVSTSSWRR